jgi:SAM-dependent methyltransferase
MMYRGIKKQLSGRFSGSLLRGCMSALKHRLLAIFSSLRFRPGECGSQDFVRYTHYQELKKWLPEHFPPDGSKPRFIEFGGSNNVIRGFLPGADYEIAPNWPDVDVQNLTGYSDESYDAVVLDNILEHVPDPFKAVAELRRILKPGGVCISATPFIIRIHEVPHDYWRFTHDGLKLLFRDFSSVDVFAWGNRVTVETTLWWGWLDCKRTKRWMRAALWNEEHWPIQYLTRAYK